MPVPNRHPRAISSAVLGGLIAAFLATTAMGDDDRLWRSTGDDSIDGRATEWRSVTAVGVSSVVQTTAATVEEADHPTHEPRSARVPDIGPQSQSVRLSETIAVVEPDESPKTSSAVPHIASQIDRPTTADLTRLAGAIFAVTVAAVLGLILLRCSRWGGGLRRTVASSLQLAGTLTLGPRNTLHLVTVEDRRFLVAVDPRGVSSITPVPEPFPDLGDAASETDDSADVLPDRAPDAVQRPGRLAALLPFPSPVARSA